MSDTKVVPVEPTEEMLEALLNGLASYGFSEALRMAIAAASLPEQSAPAREWPKEECQTCGHTRLVEMTDEENIKWCNEQSVPGDGLVERCRSLEFLLSKCTADSTLELNLVSAQHLLHTLSSAREALRLQDVRIEELQNLLLLADKAAGLGLAEVEAKEAAIEAQAREIAAKELSIRQLQIVLQAVLDRASGAEAALETMRADRALRQNAALCDAVRATQSMKEGRMVCDVADMLQVYHAAIDAALAARSADAVSSIDFQQRRGVLADTLDWAIAEYDSYMVNDDYDAQGALDTIIKRLREVRTLYAARSADGGKG